MREDDGRVRVGHGAENFGRLRHIALNELKWRELKNKNGAAVTGGIRLEQQSCGRGREFPIRALLA